MFNAAMKAIIRLIRSEEKVMEDQPRYNGFADPLLL
jgi:hypothetical protein